MLKSVVNPFTLYTICDHYYGNETKGTIYDTVTKNKTDLLSEPFSISRLKDLDIIHCQVDFLQGFFDTILPKINKKIVLCTGQFHLPQVVKSTLSKDILSHPQIVLWVSQNPIYNNSNKYLAFPYGIKHENLLEYRDILLHQNYEVKSKDVDFLPLSNLTNPCRLKLPEMQKISLSEYYKKLNNCKFIISPIGDRDDCFRHYEAIGLGTVPISNVSYFYRNIFAESMRYEESIDKMIDLITNNTSLHYIEPNRNLICTSFHEEKVRQAILPLKTNNNIASLSTWHLSGRLGNKVFQNCVINGIANYLKVRDVGYALKEETEMLGISLQEVSTVGQKDDKDLGCWIDKKSRIFKTCHGRSFMKDACAFQARQLNHKYYALQDNDECFTGNEDYKRYGESLECPYNGGAYISHVFSNDCYVSSRQYATDDLVEKLLKMSLENIPAPSNLGLLFRNSDHYYQNPFFAQYVYDSLFKSKQSRLKSNTIENDDVFILMRLGDVEEKNMERPIEEWISVISKTVSEGGRNVFISSDSMDHDRVNTVCRVFNAQKYTGTPVDTLLFGSSCAFIIADGGTYSWLLCAMAYRAKKIRYLLKTKTWHGDIFVIPEWERA